MTPRRTCAWGRVVSDVVGPTFLLPRHLQMPVRTSDGYTWCVTAIYADQTVALKGPLLDGKRRMRRTARTNCVLLTNNAGVQ